MKRFVILLICVSLSGCMSVYVKKTEGTSTVGDGAKTVCREFCPSGFFPELRCESTRARDLPGVLFGVVFGITFLPLDTLATIARGCESRCYTPDHLSRGDVVYVSADAWCKKSSPCLRGTVAVVEDITSFFKDELPNCRKLGGMEYVNVVNYDRPAEACLKIDQDKCVKIGRDKFVKIDELYTAHEGVDLKSSTGKILTKLPLATKVKIKKFENGEFLVSLGDNLQGWLAKADVSIEKPDTMKPVLRILEKEFNDPELYIKGVAYDDTEISSVTFGGRTLAKENLNIQKGNYASAYPFSAKITLSPTIEPVLKAEDKSGKNTSIVINIEEPLVDYVPGYIQLETKSKVTLKATPDINSKTIGKAAEKTLLVAVGNKNGWYYLENGGWIRGEDVRQYIIGSGEITEPMVFVAGASSRTNPETQRMLTDVDTDIPTGETRRNAVGVIISVKDYDNPDIGGVTYALNDAETMKDYFNTTLGIHKDNIIFVKNAKKSDFERLFGKENDYKGQLNNYIKPGVSDVDVFVYYVGHGVPDVNTKEAYFLPADAHPDYVRLNGYPMNLFYDNVSKLPARSVTLIVDACFSGNSEQGTLVHGASFLANIPDKKFPGTVFTASAGMQIASWYPEKGHSLFTYFFLKGIKGDADKNKDKRITLGELSEYVKEEVSYYAQRSRNREQTPEFEGDPNKVLLTYK